MGRNANKADADIDALYGLEPVYEAGSDPRLVSLSNSESVRCPHCFENNSLFVDTVYGNQSYFEDCQVCCSPMLIDVRVVAGQLKSVRASKPDGERSSDA